MTAKLGLWTGVGFVVANMIGTGVFLSAGFMAQDLGPSAILGAWVVGAVLALSGAYAYSAVARMVPRSGGEYRYLSELMHPALGYLAGWGSMLLGFSGPIAIDVLAAGAFLQTLAPGLDPRLVGSVIIVLITTMHASSLRLSQLGQNVLVSLKAALVLGFVALGFALGSRAWPAWSPPTNPQGFALVPFMASLFYIAFAFSGWNATVYASEEFARPKRDVPRAMLIGCGAVACVYLLVNWVFVANLTPEKAMIVTEYEHRRITLGHLIAVDLIGETGGRIISGFMAIAFISAASAMTFMGPRVYAAMARDGYLPRLLAARDGRPPVGAVVLQGTIALVIVHTQSLHSILHDVGAILTLFAALTALSLFRVRFFRKDLGTPSVKALFAAAVFAASAAWMLYFGFRADTSLLLWIVLMSVLALGAYLLTRLLALRSVSRR
jgi:APA family basic amino acid/polyamine antiporter